MQPIELPLFSPEPSVFWARWKGPDMRNDAAGRAGWKLDMLGAPPGHRSRI